MRGMASIRSRIGENMARIFRVSGYLVCDRETTAKELESYFDTMPGEWWQQFHIEQSEEFNLDGEDKGKEFDGFRININDLVK